MTWAPKRTQSWKLAEEEGFEPPVPFGTTVFKTAAFVHSATPPTRLFGFQIADTLIQERLRDTCIPGAECDATTEGILSRYY